MPVSAPAVSGVVPCFPPRVDGSHAHASAPTDAFPLFTISICLRENITTTLGAEKSTTSVWRGFSVAATDPVACQKRRCPFAALRRVIRSSLQYRMSPKRSDNHSFSTNAAEYEH